MNEIKCFSLNNNNGKLLTLITSCRLCPPFEGNNPLSNSIIEYNALWDTGATGTVITKKVVDELNLKPTGMRTVYHAGGKSEVNTYQISIILPNEVGVKNVVVTEAILQQFDVLIGMDIITLGDFSITNYNNNTCFSFRIPSTEKIDFVEQIKPTQIINNKKIRRNEDCHCGSGKKYKICCGKNK